jgi:enoyl-CoA hydratase
LEDKTLSSSDKMLAAKEGRVGIMTFNNPEKRNAVSYEMWVAAEAILKDFAADPEVRVVVLTGAGGKAFVSGADISKFESERASQEATERYNAQTERIYSTLYAFEKPTIAMIRGFCVGGGLNLAICCDMRIATAESRFALPAAKLGLGYGYERVRRLAESIGLSKTLEVIYTGRQFSAQEALDMGFVQRVVRDAELDSVVAETAASIAQNAPLTIALAKASARELGKPEAARDLARLDAMVKACFDSQDYAEGRRAFMEKRKPNFQGK